MASHWLQVGLGIPGDANGDGIINGQDLAVMASHWLDAASGTAAAVPEPSTAFLVTIGVALIVTGRWRMPLCLSAR